jgi:hypothetical protein
MSGNVYAATLRQRAVTQFPRRRKYYPRHTAAGKARVSERADRQERLAPTVEIIERGTY